MHLDTIEDAEEIRDHLLRAIYGNFYNAKQNPANSNLDFSFLPYIAGKRESRRLMGDHLIIQSDVQNGVYFEDAVGTATWGIDLHYPTAHQLPVHLHLHGGDQVVLSLPQPLLAQRSQPDHGRALHQRVARRPGQPARAEHHRRRWAWRSVTRRRCASNTASSRATSIAARTARWNCRRASAASWPQRPAAAAGIIVDNTNSALRDHSGRVDLLRLRRGLLSARTTCTTETPTKDRNPSASARR